MKTKFDPLKSTQKKTTDLKSSIGMNSVQNRKFFSRLLRFVSDGRAVAFPITNGTQTTLVAGTVSRCSSGYPVLYFSWPENFGTAPSVGNAVEVYPAGLPRFI